MAKHPNKAAKNPNMLKLSSVTEVRSIPPTIGTKDAQILQSKYFLQTNHCKTTVPIHRGWYDNMNSTKQETNVIAFADDLWGWPVVAGVNDLIVCINETGM